MIRSRLIESLWFRCVHVCLYYIMLFYTRNMRSLLLFYIFFFFSVIIIFSFAYMLAVVFVLLVLFFVFSVHCLFVLLKCVYFFHFVLHFVFACVPLSIRLLCISANLHIPLPSPPFFVFMCTKFLILWKLNLLLFAIVCKFKPLLAVSLSLSRLYVSTLFSFFATFICISILLFFYAKQMKERKKSTQLKQTWPMAH